MVKPKLTNFDAAYATGNSLFVGSLQARSLTLPKQGWRSSKAASSKIYPRINTNARNPVHHAHSAREARLDTTGLNNSQFRGNCRAKKLKQRRNWRKAKKEMGKCAQKQTHTTEPTSQQ